MGTCGCLWVPAAKWGQCFLFFQECPVQCRLYLAWCATLSIRAFASLPDHPSHFHPAPFLPTAALDDGVVLVSCTDGELDTAGRLHALNATSGAPLWEFDAMDNGTSYGLHYVPAVDNTR